MWKEFGTPVVLGILVFAGITVWQPEAPTPPLQDGIGRTCEDCLTWPFQTTSSPGALLVIRDAPAPFVQEPACEGCPNIHWHTERVGLVAPACNCTHAVALQSSNRTVDIESDLLHLTFYVFTESGELIASNAPDEDLARFRLYGDFLHWNTSPWYFGSHNSTAQRMPFDEGQAKLLLSNLPVGGVATMQVANHEYDWLVGPVWLTARVESTSPAQVDRLP